MNCPPCMNTEICAIAGYCIKGLTDKRPLWEGFKKMNRIPEFHEMLEKMKEIHEKKNMDYASSANPFSNFERSAELISWFEEPTDKAFVALIATKLARLAELLQSGKVAQNESIDDSFLDLATYCVLWASYNKQKNNKQIIICPNLKCSHRGLFHSEFGCSLCGCGIKNSELYPGSIIPVKDDDL